MTILYYLKPHYYVDPMHEITNRDSLKKKRQKKKKDAEKKRKQEEELLILFGDDTYGR